MGIILTWSSRGTTRSRLPCWFALQHLLLLMLMPCMVPMAMVAILAMVQDILAMVQDILDMLVLDTMVLAMESEFMVLLLLLSLLSMVVMLVLADMLPTLLVLFMLPSVRLRLNQKLMLMLSMELMDMEDMVLDTVLTLLDMDMDMVLDMAPLHLAMDMVMDWDMLGMDMASVLLMLSQRLMLSMELMAMVDMVLDT